MKGVVFLVLMAVLTVIPYSMRRYEVVATHLASLRPFVFGEREVPYEAGSRKGVPSNTAQLVLPCDTPYGSVISAAAYPSVWEDQTDKGDTRKHVSRRYGLSLALPADWVEKGPLLDPREVLRIGPPGQGEYRVVAITVVPLCLYSLEQSPRVLASLLGDTTRMLYEKNSRLKDGAYAYEAEFECMKEGKEVTTIMLATLKGRTLIMAHLSDTSGPSDEEMKRILYSLTTTRGAG